MKNKILIKEIIDTIGRNATFNVHYVFDHYGMNNWYISRRKTDDNMIVFERGGIGDYIVEDKVYPIKKGRVFYVSSNIFNEGRQNDQYPISVIAIRFDLEFNKIIKLTKGSFVVDIDNYEEMEEKFLMIAKTDDENVRNSLMISIILDCYISILRKEKSENSHKRKFHKLDEYIRKHDFSSLTLSKASSLVGWSEKYFSIMFKKTYGVTFRQYLFLKKIQYAKELVLESDLSVAEISRHIGYSDPYIFSNQFKNAFGLSPKAFREKN